LAQGAAREIRALRDVKNGTEGRLVDGAAIDRPKTAQDAKERRLAATIGADDKQMIAVLKVEGQSLDKNVAVGGDDRSMDVH
jgi:hypothetical protein